MASAWGVSFGSAWGNSWGGIAAEVQFVPSLFYIDEASVRSSEVIRAYVDTYSKDTGINSKKRYAEAAYVDKQNAEAYNKDATSTQDKKFYSVKRSGKKTVQYR